MVQAHHGTFLMHKKGEKWIISRDMDGSRAYYTESSNSESGDLC